MSTIQSLHEQLGPSLQHLKTSQIIIFVLSISHLKNYILSSQNSRHDPSEAPETLDLETFTFLMQSCNMAESEAQGCWEVLKESVWRPDEYLSSVMNDRAMQQSFRINGGRPPTSVCIYKDCDYVKAGKKLKLQGLHEGRAILYTMAAGPLPPVII
ncbi:hypothetical protein VNI00_015952 [Paramarasmius palmivorus]|uniref:Uncharacterized protein n=1 Tax=Paramarasmius palmivorus TaxID=297713 RepID=A0AAW0BGW1_9AGAR